MKVIPHGSGWDIALDIVFTDQATANTIAKRLQPAMHALLREAVDASMCERKTPEDARKETISQRVSPTNLKGSTVSATTEMVEPWSGPTFHSTLGGLRRQSTSAHGTDILGC